MWATIIYVLLVRREQHCIVSRNKCSVASTTATGLESSSRRPRAEATHLLVESMGSEGLYNGIFVNNTRGRASNPIEYFCFRLTRNSFLELIVSQAIHSMHGELKNTNRQYVLALGIGIQVYDIKGEVRYSSIWGQCGRHAEIVIHT